MEQQARVVERALMHHNCVGEALAWRNRSCRQPVNAHACIGCAGHRNLRVDATTDDGALLVTVTSGQDKHGIPIDLLPWLLGWGAGVEVLGPQQLRAAVEKELRAAASAYDDPDSGRVT
jgi:hypothetical protein